MFNSKGRGPSGFTQRGGVQTEESETSCLLRHETFFSFNSYKVIYSSGFPSLKGNSSVDTSVFVGQEGANRPHGGLNQGRKTAF